MENKLPLTWEYIFQKQSFLPVIVKTIEKVHDASWAQKQVSVHDHFEMVYMKHGESVFYVADTGVTLMPNDMIIIKPGQPHKFEVTSTGECEFLVLSFKFDDSDSKQIRLNDFIEFANDDQQSHVKLRLSRKNDIANVMNRILREQSRQEEWSKYLNYLLIMELFILISRALKRDWEQNSRSRSVKLKELLQISKEYIDNNYSSDITLSDLANYIFLSESYFAHTFRDEFGISPKRYLLEVRINMAKDILANTDQKINDVAKEVGFSSQQRFNDIFKKYEKATPLKYRKIAKKELLNTIR